MDRYYGFDLGDAESAITFLKKNTQTDPEVVPVREAGSFITAYARLRTGELLIGEEACYTADAAERCLRFKSRFLTDPLSARDVKSFAGGVLGELYMSGSLIKGEDCCFYIGCPAGWNQSERERYREIFEAAGYPPVRVVSESRAALISACQSRHFQVGYDILSRPVLVVDMGSSTTDFAYINSGREVELQTGGEVALGGGIMDELILEAAVDASPDRDAIRAVFAQSPPWRSYCEFAARRLKEKYFSDEDYWKMNGCTRTLTIAAEVNSGNAAGSGRDSYTDRKDGNTDRNGSGREAVPEKRSFFAGLFGRRPAAAGNTQAEAGNTEKPAAAGNALTGTGNTENPAAAGNAPAETGRTESPAAAGNTPAETGRTESPAAAGNALTGSEKTSIISAGKGAAGKARQILRLQLEMNEEIAGRILEQPAPQLDGRSFHEVFAGSLREIRHNLGGGTVHMPAAADSIDSADSAGGKAGQRKGTAAAGPADHSPEQNPPGYHSTAHELPEYHSTENCLPESDSPEYHSPERYSPEPDSPGFHFPEPDSPGFHFPEPDSPGFHSPETIQTPAIQEPAEKRSRSALSGSENADPAGRAFSQHENHLPELLFLTGGVSRMPALRAWCRQAFPEAIVITGAEPEYSVSRGLAYSGRIDEELRAFRQEVRELVDSSTVERIVEEHVEDLFHRTVDALVEPILRNAAIPVFDRWRSGEIRRLSDIDSEMEREIDAYLHSSQAADLLVKPITAWLRPIAYRLEEHTMPICVRHNVPYRALSLTSYLSLAEIDVHVNARDVFAVEELTWMVNTIISILVGLLCGGSGIALISSGISGIFAGAMLTLLLLFLGKDKMESAFMNMDIPTIMRKVLPRGYFEARMEKISGEVKRSCFETLEKDKSEEVSHRMVAEISGQIEECLMRMAEVVEIPLGG